MAEEYQTFCCCSVQFLSKIKSKSFKMNWRIELNQEKNCLLVCFNDNDWWLALFFYFFATIISWWWSNFRYIDWYSSQLICGYIIYCYVVTHKGFHFVLFFSVKIIFTIAIIMMDRYFVFNDQIFTPTKPIN